MKIRLRPVAPETALLLKISSFLHDAKVVEAKISPAEGVVSLLLKRMGYEHGYMLSNGWWGFGRRWMYPWVECRLVVSPVSAAREQRHATGVDEFDTLMSIRLEEAQLIIHREFSDITIDLLEETSLDLRDAGIPVNREEGAVFFSKNPLDLSYIEDLLDKIKS